MTEKERQAIRDFLIDISCLNKLNKWKSNFNLFDVLKITNMEIRHSNILAWLFDPNENHQIGDRFIKEFIARVVSKRNNGQIDDIDFLLQDFYSYQVYRESNHMDIVLASREERTAIIIENKIWSGESSHQLKDYFNKSKEEYSDYKLLYVFLTPDGHDASDTENWIPFSYEEIIESLDIAINGISFNPDVELLIRNYIETIRRNIMKEKDEELVRICNEIYNKHRTAIRLIFENVSVNSSIDSEIICNTLKELGDEHKIIYQNNNSWSFFTESMNKYLPELLEPNSSWGTNYIYYYWFDKNDEYISIHLELGGWGLNDELKERQIALIRASNKNENYKRFCRIYYKKVKINQDDYENSLEKAVRTLVKSALENEKRILNAV